MNKKPRAVKGTCNICGECVFFVEPPANASGISELMLGECELVNKEVEYKGGACKHFKYKWEYRHEVE